ncbi:MAG: polysaccharide deacetylase family protein [Eubacteriales bacterium]|nr:polysaccharide deacetylase family protein [Eubacteriales bacterium]
MNKIKIVYVLVAGSILIGSFFGCAVKETKYCEGEVIVHSTTDSGNEKNKVSLERTLREKEAYYEYPNDKLSWWIKRDNHHGQSGCDDTLVIGEYGAYYVDPTVADNTTESVIYLTFDCGYENGYTDAILDCLKSHDATACFFVTKTYIRDNAELVKRMKEEGHLVGNHTITHPSMPEKSYEEIIQEVDGCANYMKEVTGYEMDPYLRPPRGEYSARTLMLTHDLGFKTVFWSMAYKDYDVNDQPGADYVISHFRKYHHNGAIVLMHNVSVSNKEALDTVLTDLENEGYRFASLNELE